MGRTDGGGGVASGRPNASIRSGKLPSSRSIVRSKLGVRNGIGWNRQRMPKKDGLRQSCWLGRCLLAGEGYSTKRGNFAADSLQVQQWMFYR
jgi:hypothetical protein